jgi:TolA-binding protein
VLVTTRYPQSSRAPTALYKHALILLQAGRTAEGRDALDQVVRKYPRSDEAELARERLRALR